MLRDLNGLPMPTLEEFRSGNFRFSAEDMEKIKDVIQHRRDRPRQNGFFATLPPVMPAPKRLNPPVAELLARIKPYLVSTAMDLKDRKLTVEFDDVSVFGGLLVEANPDDPRVIAAASFAVCQYNQLKDSRNPNTFVDLVSVIKVNSESLEPKLHGLYYYMTLETRDRLGNSATYQAKVFSSDIRSMYLKLFRRPRNYDPNGSSSDAPSKDDYEAVDVNEIVKRGNMREMAKENEDPKPMQKRESFSAGDIMKSQKMREMAKENEDPEPMRKRENFSAGVPFGAAAV